MVWYGVVHDVLDRTEMMKRGVSIWAKTVPVLPACSTVRIDDAGVVWCGRVYDVIDRAERMKRGVSILISRCWSFAAGFAANLFVLVVSRLALFSLSFLCSYGGGIGL